MAWGRQHISWADFPELDMFVIKPAWATRMAFALTSTCVAWLLRGLIARAQAASALWISACSTWLGGGFFMLFFMLCLMPGEFQREFIDEGLGGSIAQALRGCLSGVILGVIFSSLFLPITLPLGWVSILLLRRASGGLAAPRGSLGLNAS